MKPIRVFSAAAALLVVATSAQAQHGQGGRRGRQDQPSQAIPQGQHAQASPQVRAQASPQNQQRSGGSWRGPESQPRAIDPGRDSRAGGWQAPADRAHIAQDQGRQQAAQQSDQWRDRQNREPQQQQQEEVQRAQRAEQEARDAQVQERERQDQVSHSYDRDRDDLPGYAYRPGYDYRYNVRGVYRETNQFGVDALRQAVDQGYERGYRAGSIDRDDGAPADFQRALGFESEGFGYTGAYVTQDDYGYYFSEGFQRGYDDGYWNRSQYGTFSNGKAAILGAVALGILGITMIH